MFRWFNKHRRTAAASARRRASQGRTCEDDQITLLNHAVEFATFFLQGGQMPSLLSVRDGFPSFGVGIDSRGELVEFNCLPKPGQPDAFNVFLVRDQLALFAGTPLRKPSPEETRYHEPVPIGLVADGIKQCAAGGKVHTVALVDRVEVPAANAGGMTDAIRIQIEHVETSPVVWYQPYRLADREVEYGERSSQSGRSFVFG
jgi:hypothetical protein